MPINSRQPHYDANALACLLFGAGVYYPLCYFCYLVTNPCLQSFARFNFQGQGLVPNFAPEPSPNPSYNFPKNQTPCISAPFCGTLRLFAANCFPSAAHFLPPSFASSAFIRTTSQSVRRLRKVVLRSKNCFFF